MLIPILIVSAIALQACTLSALPTASSAVSSTAHSTRSESVSTRSFTSGDSGTTIQANLGDTMTIQLPENPTTGFRWAIQDADDSILDLQSSDYKTAQPGVGGGGQRTFTFGVKAAGTTDLQLKEWREWEGDRSITQRFNITIQAQ